MTTDDSRYLADRRAEDERAYLINSVDPEIAPKLAPAMGMLRALLVGSAPGYVEWDRALAGMVRSSEIAVRTAENMIRKLIKHEFVIKRGAYARTYNRRTKRWSVSDTRALRLGDWPTEHDPE